MDQEKEIDKSIKKAEQLEKSLGKIIDALKNATKIFGEELVFDQSLENINEVANAIMGVKIGVELATQAQLLWNAAMGMTEIQLIIAAVSGLAGGLLALCQTVNEERTAQELLAEAHKKAGDQYGVIGKAAEDYYNGIDSAKNILDNFNRSIIVSEEKQQGLASQMDDVQNQITEIARIASEKRRDMTEEEIKKLDNLFEEMRNLTKVELEMQRQYQQSVLDQAEIFVRTFEGSVEVYEVEAQKYIHSAEEARKEVVEKAEERRQEELMLLRASMDAKNTLYTEDFINERAKIQENFNIRGELYSSAYQEELAELQKRHEEAGTLESEVYASEKEALMQKFSERGELYSATYQNEIEQLQNRYSAEENLYSEAYYKEAQAINENYQNAVDKANQKCVDTMGIISDEYAQRIDIHGIYASAEAEANKKEEEEKNRHNEEIDILNGASKKNVLAYWEYQDALYFDFHKEIVKEEEDYKNNLERIEAETLANLDENSLKQIGIFLQYIAKTELYGGEVSQEHKEIANKILDAYEKLPEESKEVMKESMSGMLLAMQDKEPILYLQASGMAGNILNRLNTAFDIHSPSRKTRAIFHNVMEGAEMGMADETPKLYEQTNRVAEGVLDNLQDIGVSDFIAQISAAVSAQTSGRAAYRMALGSAIGKEIAAMQRFELTQAGAGAQPIYVETHVQLGDETELAVALTPAIEKEMAFRS